MTAIHHPAPVNQFYRLDRDSPTSPWVKTTRWNHVHADANGHVINWDSTLCSSTGGAVLLDAHTGGTKRASPGAVHDHQNDMLGGIGVDDVEVALMNGWGVDLYRPDDFAWADTIYSVRAQRRACEIGVDYGKVPYEFQAQKGGDFPHAMVIEDFRSSDSQIRVYDSLAANPRWMPQSAIRPAAEALALQERGTKYRLFVAFTKMRPLLTAYQPYRVACIGGVDHPTPLKKTPYGTTAAKVTTASYACSRHSVVNPATGKAQWWYQVVSKVDGKSTANAGLWISPTRYTKVTEL